MKERNVVLMPIAQADGQKKIRPVLLLREMQKYGDFLVCGIISQLQQYISSFDELIQLKDVDFPGSGLVKPYCRSTQFSGDRPSCRSHGTVGND